MVTGFASATLLTTHFDKHNSWDFRYQDEQEYLLKAKAFVEADRTVSGSEECEDSDGDIVRYHPLTHEFAIVEPPNAMHPDYIIRTYFKPMPKNYAPSGWPPEKTHDFASDYDYFRDNC